METWGEKVEKVFGELVETKEFNTNVAGETSKKIEIYIKLDTCWNIEHCFKIEKITLRRQKTYKIKLNFQRFLVRLLIINKNSYILAIEFLAKAESISTLHICVFRFFFYIRIVLVYIFFVQVLLFLYVLMTFFYPKTPFWKEILPSLSKPSRCDFLNKNYDI